MGSSAFAFFLFSYQVHEKSVLLPVLPVTLLGPDAGPLACWLPALAAFSMFPLLQRDGLSTAYCAALLLWAACAAGGWEDLQPSPRKAEGQSQALQQEPLRQRPFKAPRGGVRYIHGLLTAVSRGRSEHAKVDGIGDVRSGSSFQGRFILLMGRMRQWMPAIGLFTAILVHLFAVTTMAPAKLPFLHDAAFTCSSFAFLAVAAYSLSTP